MTKRQRRAMYLEAARAVLERRKTGVYSACPPDVTEMPELEYVTGEVCGWELAHLSKDLRAMLLILAATI